MADRAERDRLILEYRPAARLVALQARRRMPAWIELEDLEQWACVGLVQAAEEYDPAMQVPFVAYAWRLMRARVWDQYRRGRFRQEMVASVPVESAHVAEEPISAEELDKARLKAQVYRAVLTLPERDRTVLALYYGNGLFHRQVGERLHVNESRACQLNKRALERLRRAMERATATTHPAAT